MNLLDGLALLVIGLSAVSALMKGLTAELFWLASVVLGFLIAVHTYSSLADWLLELNMPPIVAGFLGFAAVFVGVMALGTFVSHLVRRFWKVVRLTWLDRLLGAAFGVLRGVLIVTVVFMALTAFPVDRQWLSESRLGPYFLTCGRAMAQLAPQDFKDLFRSGSERVYRIWLEREPETEERR